MKRTPLLPLHIDDLDAYRPIYRNPNIWLPALREICRRHGLDAGTLDFAPPGSNIVFWVATDRLIKLFPPLFAEDCTRESLALSALPGQREFEIPNILFSGEVEGWPYLVLNRLSGVSLDTVWSNLGTDERQSIAVGLGRMIAALHRTPTAGLEQLGPPDWARFILKQADTCLERQRAVGASPAWLADIADFIAALPPLVTSGFQPVLINADLNPEHIFCRQTAAGWEVCGIIDFGDAMLGHPFYEFVCPGILFAGSPSLQRAMLLAYGLPASVLNETLSRQLTAYILLHRFTKVTQFPELFPQRTPTTMRELQEITWSF